MKPLQILVVEDDALLAMLLGELLAGMGHEVCATAANQSEAVAAAARYKPDLMIVDSALREGSGVSAVDEILLARPIAHLFVSGNTERIKALKPGAVVLSKPFRAADLTKVIAVALEIAREPAS